jgi:hypothetical protein
MEKNYIIVDNNNRWLSMGIGSGKNIEDEVFDDIKEIQERLRADGEKNVTLHVFYFTQHTTIKILED